MKNYINMKNHFEYRVGLDEIVRFGGNAGMVEFAIRKQYVRVGW